MPKRPASEPVTALAGPVGHPLHPALIPVPIGAWVAALVFDIGSYAVSDPSFLVRGATWLVAIGVLGALAAAGVGALDLLAIPTGTRAFRVGLTHAGVALAATVVFAVDLLVRRGIDQTEPVGAVPLALSIAGVVVIGVGGYLGGSLAFRYGVRVADTETDSDTESDVDKEANR